MNHNWSATKQRLHPQTGFDSVGHRLGLATGAQISVCKSPFPSAGTAVSLFRAKTVQPREVETRLPDCGVAHQRPPADLWRAAIRRGHTGATLRSSTTTR